MQVSELANLNEGFILHSGNSDDFMQLTIIACSETNNYTTFKI